MTSAAATTAAGATADPLTRLFAHVDAHANDYVKRLFEAVAIPSVSTDPAHRKDVIRMSEYIVDWLKRLGAHVETKTPTDASVSEPLPPIVFGRYPANKDAALRTVCIYAHYDVQPAKREDGWASEPFVPEERDGKIYGRGSTDDKGPLLSWLWVIEALQQLGQAMPVNLKFMFEGMEESNSEGLDAMVRQEAQAGGFLSDVDYICISDNYWLGRNKPCLTYGVRGISYFFVEVASSDRDLHSGVYGGTAGEAMIDLVHLLSRLVDSRGRIQVPGIMDQVAPVTEAERQLYRDIDFSPADFAADAGLVGAPLHDSKEALLMHRWRFPSLTVHGVEGSWDGAGAKTVIPRRVIGKFSIRLVPDMLPARTEKLVHDYLHQEFAKLNSPNRLTVTWEEGCRAWCSSFQHPNYVAAAAAVKRVFGVEPDMTREGGSIPITLTFEEATGKNVLLLPIGACDDGAHSQNEKLNRSNYIEGIKVLAAYLFEVARI